MPHVGLTTILAFGDSITEGEVPVPGEFSQTVHYVEPEKSYPADLTALTNARYTLQNALRIDAFCGNDPPSPTGDHVTIVNAGCLGEPAGSSATLMRLNDKIAVYHPDLVLLMEGTNDLDSSNPSGSIASATIGIRNLVQLARSHGAIVFVGTIPPQVASELTHGGTPDLVQPYNAAMTPIATAAGAQIVDIYSDLSMDIPDWISPLDGLHPTEAGYTEIARVWFTAIENQFESVADAARRRK
jgi:lysophospholipase L1-like esterase